MFGKTKKVSDASVEELARTFAKIVKRNYTEYLRYWKLAAQEGANASKEWQARIETEPEIVEENVYNRILKIVSEPQNYKRLFQKNGIFSEIRK